MVEAELRVRPCERLALCGHSLGGALAMTLLGAGFVAQPHLHRSTSWWPGRPSNAEQSRGLRERKHVNQCTIYTTNCQTSSR